ncbi:MAG: molybdopterin-dependent oxidoreductase [Nanoarchaeota archaeon]
MRAWIFILGILMLAGCDLRSSYDGLSGASSRVLAPSEVREYSGEKLGSVSDFRENSIKGPQYVNMSDYKLEIVGLVDDERSYTYDEVIGFDIYSKIVTLYCVEGWDVKIWWEGILVRDLIGDVVEGANTAIFYAYDGYSTSLPLDYIMDNNILLAYKMNNVTLPPERGFPFQLVAEDRWGYKWIKWVTKIEISDNPNYEGYWEKRGYNQDGSLDGPKFG